MSGHLMSEHVFLVSCRVCAIMEMGLATVGADEEPYILLSQPEDFECEKCQAESINKDRIKRMEEQIKQQAEEIQDLQKWIDTLRRIEQVEKELDTAASILKEDEEKEAGYEEEKKEEKKKEDEEK